MKTSSGINFTLPPEQEATPLREGALEPAQSLAAFTTRSIPQRFETVVRLYADRLAVKMGARALTYRELDRTSDEIAQAVAARTNLSAKPVALLFEHGIELIAAIFGTLKAGRYSLVLEPSSPTARLRQVVRHCQADLIVTGKKNFALSQNVADGRALLLNIDELSPGRDDGKIVVPVRPDAPAIMTYTAGSTGAPKAVIRDHRTFLQSFIANAGEKRVTVEDRIGLLHLLNFGSAYTDLFCALLSGASLFPFDPRVHGIHRLQRWLKEEEITICHFPVALYRQVVESLSAEHASLRLIHLSGAPINEKDFELFKNHLPKQTWLGISMGSTETRGICSALVDRNFSFPKDGSPAGYPRDGKQILLLDENGHEVAPGEIGELAVWDRNLNASSGTDVQATDDRFIPHPSMPRERIYRTGDLARQLPDGFLVHMGRTDSILKIRGYRVSRDEVEAALLEYAPVREAAVVAWDDAGGEKYLAAYVVARTAERYSAGELLALLRTKLPAYMIPTQIIFLDQLPQTGGKIDRKLLPRPEPNCRAASRSDQAPTTAIEAALVQMWQDVLAVRSVGIHDNFFELGGHSLAATRIVARVVEQFRLDIPLPLLFAAPTIAQMATVVAEHGGRHIGNEELKRILIEIETLSEEEAQRLLANIEKDRLTN